MMIGTAGHIDHGKTSLVRALTGTDTDRLPEEKKRGMSIELGYAFLAPSDDGPAVGKGSVAPAATAGQTEVVPAFGLPREPIAFIDVPGHEKLLHTMISGATGIDFALLLVAADDGVMPQTREHLAVLSLLGIDRGVVAITKIDRVDEARVQEVAQQVTVLLADTPLAHVPIIPVSATRGDGVVELRQLLRAEAARLDAAHGADGGADPHGSDSPVRAAAATEPAQTTAETTAALPAQAGFRLAIDRVFSLDGVGTVATGTVHAGRVQVGDVLQQLPDGPKELRVRSLHAQNRSTDTAHAGQRCAINLAGVEREQLQRGHWLAQPGIASVSDRLDVELHLWHAEPRAIRSGTRVHVHLGTTSSPAAVAVLDADTLAPGSTGLAQLVLPQPLAAWHGDRLILRDAAGQRIIGGGRVLDSRAPVRYRRTPQRLQLLQALQRPALSDRLAGLLEACEHGVDLRQWQQVLGLASVAAFDASLQTLPHRRLAGDFIIGESAWQHLRRTVLDTLAAYHQNATDEIGPDAARLRRLARLRMDDAHWRLLLDALVKEGSVAQSGAFVHLPEHGSQLAARDETLLQRLTPHLMEAGAQGAWVRDLAEHIGEPAANLRPAMARLARSGHLYQVVKDLYLDAATAARLAALVRQLALESKEPVESDLAEVQQASNPLPILTVARFRDASGLGRKRAVQMLEFFDRIGLCRRVGDTHVLRLESEVFKGSSE
ncbi:SelB C-terminal domain-containing protein [Lautropia mirabilis]|uniref:selenocysteine-specific translation elongation factor n=1 Tax=Lautropia mirabilis TaxID=47671 RepID=UPI00234A32E8|nr:SelB C-terminal domain-containing protein [Lautropia mirabilis]MDC6094844.1 SelB C-terminal domain-containing protein [Lautropia mirabilis]